MPTYQVFGLTFTSDDPFAYALLPGHGTADFSFACTNDVTGGSDMTTATPIYASPHRTESGDCTLRVFRQSGAEVMQFAGIAEYRLWPDRIECAPYSPDGLGVEATFLSAVLAYWLERRGTVALHASAVTVDDGALAFLSNSGHGKSGLAAAMIQSGSSLLTDDILPVAPSGAAWVTHPGYATMRMWPDEAAFFLGAYQELPRVDPRHTKRRVDIGGDGWGTFCGTPQPLVRICVPDRRRDPAETGDDVVVTRLAPREAVLELVRHSFTARLTQSAGLQPQRMGVFAQIASHVPMYRVSYPSGFDRLAHVIDVLRRGVDSDSPAASPPPSTEGTT